MTRQTSKPSKSNRGLIVVLTGFVALLLMGSVSLGVVIISRKTPTPSTPVPTPTTDLTRVAIQETAAQTASATIADTATNSPSPTVSPTAIVITSTATDTSTESDTNTPEDTATETQTATTTLTPSVTFTPSVTVLPSLTPTATPWPIPNFEPVGDSSLYIPKLDLGTKAIPVVTLPLDGDTWNVDSLQHNVGHLDETSWVGDQGNIVLVGHIQLAAHDFGPFLNLRNLEPGDHIMLVDKGLVYAYEVTEKTTVDPTEIDVTYPTIEPTMTLITCTVWDPTRGVFAKRLIVKAKRVRVVSVSDIGK